MKIHLRLLLASLVMTGLALLSSHRGSAAEIVYESTGRRDPFVPLIGPGGVILRSFDPSGYQVEGIIYDQIDGSLALINGEFYKEGEKVKTATVKKIHTDRVILTEDDEEIALWLNPDTQNGGEKNDKKK